MSCILMMLCLVLLTEKSIVRQLAGAGRHVYDSAREDVENRIERNKILREQRLQEREDQAAGACGKREAQTGRKKPADG